MGYCYAKKVSAPPTGIVLELRKVNVTRTPIVPNFYITGIIC